MATSTAHVDSSRWVDRERVLSGLEAGYSVARRLGQRILVSVTTAVADFDSLASFAAGDGRFSERRFWAAPNGTRTMVGLGSAWSREISGENRFAIAANAWNSCCHNAVIETPSDSGVTGPVVLAGFSFDPIGIRSNLWSKFPSGLLVLPRFAVTTIEGQVWLTINTMVDPGSDVDAIQESTDAELVSVLHPPRLDALAAPTLSVRVRDVRSPEDWQALVGETALRLANGDGEKVVLARSIQLDATRRFDVTSALSRLQTNYPGCYRFAIARGDSCFLGASPEQLALVEGRTVRTVCLAGSAARGTTADEDRLLGEALLSSTKNRSEHAIVVRWVRDTLTGAGIDLAPDVAPSLLKFQNVQHLYTPVEGQLPIGGTVLDLVEHLHPTPSVGGQPREFALDYLRDHEHLDRGWYAGAVGWVDALGQGEFAVAIRSALVKGTTATLFAGCGVVPDSVPEQEFAEARIKLRPMLAALGATVA